MRKLITFSGIALASIMLSACVSNGKLTKLGAFTCNHYTEIMVSLEAAETAAYNIDDPQKRAAALASIAASREGLSICETTF